MHHVCACACKPACVVRAHVRVRGHTCMCMRAHAACGRGWACGTWERCRARTMRLHCGPMCGQSRRRCGLGPAGAPA
jgi:hypothetical protein